DIKVGNGPSVHREPLRLEGEGGSVEIPVCHATAAHHCLGSV
ncbi:MAG: hypothetical protein AVDCRST_MAG43-1155, partial [uncultured Thermomicrobiales bacterium]